MLERELKLHVPPASRRAVRDELLALGAREKRLRARYFDTPERELALAGIAIRLRLEGEQWVQTVKAPGPDEISRIELNHNRPGPELDLSVYAHTPLADVLGRLSQPLAMRYETDILRLTVTQAATAAAGKAEVELAYDTGTVRTGDCELAVCELELELVSGPAQAIFALGSEWVRKHGLVLDLRSKAERGDLLARHVRPEQQGWLRPANSVAAVPDAGRQTADDTPGNGLRIDPCALGLLKPQRARAVELTRDMTIQQAYLACLTGCINHVVRNATLLAGVDTEGASAALQGRYVHQLRIGIRRLRTCWGFFDKWVAVAPALYKPLRRFFMLLGKVSDNDVLRFEIAPRLAKAGMPPLPAPEALRIAQASHHDPRELAASPAFQQCLLSLLAHQLETAEQAAGKGTKRQGNDRRGKHVHRDLGVKLEARLSGWLRQLCREGRNFERLPEATQHDLRKRLKRLRYSLDFSEAVLPGQQLASIRALLAPLQHDMGELNDMYNARDYYQRLAETEPAALFAIGWLKARQDLLKQQIQEDLDRLEAAGRA